MPLWPGASYAAIAFILFVIVMIGLVPDSRPAIFVGAVWVVLLALSYRFFVKDAGKRRYELVDETGAIEVQVEPARPKRRRVR